MNDVNRVHVIEVPLAYNEHLYLTPLSDVHIETADCDVAQLKKLMAERNKLGNHRAFIIGDVVDLVVPRDQKRWRPSVYNEYIQGRDDWINATVEYATDELNGLGVKIDMVSPGNHEDECMKRHGIDITSLLAYGLKCRRGAYSGYIIYKLCRKKNDGTVCKKSSHLFRVAYHHGAWGGRASKGYSGAKHWFESFEGWDMAVFGHNHQLHAHKDRKAYYSSVTGKLRYRDVYYVNTGSWVKSLSPNGKKVSYSERRGHPPVPNHTPLIKVSIQRNGALKYSVEV